MANATCERCGREKADMGAQQYRPIWGYAAGALCDTCYGWALSQHELGDEFTARTSHPASGEPIPATARMDVVAPVKSPAPVARPACELIHEDSFHWPTPGMAEATAHVGVWIDGKLTVCLEADDQRLALNGPPREVLARLIALAYAAATQARAYELFRTGNDPFKKNLEDVRSATGESSDGGTLYRWRGDELIGYVPPGDNGVHTVSDIFGPITQISSVRDDETLCSELHFLWHVTALPNGKALPLDGCK